MNKPIWIESTPQQKTILITLLMMANHKYKEWEWKGIKFKADPGQFVTSLEKIALKSGKGITIQNVRTALKRFEKYEFLTNESTNKNRLITIRNWEVYQLKEEELTDESTSNQQATNKQLTTNKNDKECKNEKTTEMLLKIENLRLRYSENQLRLLDEYIEILKLTRTKGQITNSVILKVYEYMNKYPPIVVEYSTYVIVNNPEHHSKKETYLFGILRNTAADKAVKELKKFNEKEEDLSIYDINNRG